MKKQILLSLSFAVISSVLFTGCSGKTISAENAKETALKHAGVSKDQVTFVKSTPDYDDGKKVYEVEFYTKDFVEYDYEINAETGDIISFDTDAEGFSPVANPNPQNTTTSDNTVSETDAKAIALEKVPGATDADIREFKLEYDDGIKKYEGKIYYNSMEYEFEINAETGEIISWESESIYD